MRHRAIMSWQPMSVALRSLSLFIILFSVLWLVIPAPALTIEFSSTVQGHSQVYFADEDNSLSEECSERQQIGQGSNRFVVPIPTLTQWVRWDPVDGTGEFTAKAIRLKVLAIEFLVPWASVSAWSDISRMDRKSGNLMISAAPATVDPALKIVLPYKKILSIQIFGIALLTVALLLCIFLYRRAYIRVLRMQKHLADVVRKETVDFKLLPWLVIVAIVFWLTSLTSYTISIDQELAIFAKDQSVWVGQGRWTTYLLAHFILPQPVIPFFTHFIFCVSASVSYLLVLRAHSIPANRYAVFLFPIYMAYPTWYFIGEFYANILSVSVGLVLCSAALLIVVRTMPLKHGDSIFRTGVFWPFLSAAIAVATAVGAYQTYILAFFSMGVGALLFQGMRTRTFSYPVLLRQLTYLLLTGILSVAIYWSVSAAMKKVLGQESPYIDGFVQGQIFLDRPWHVLMSTVTEALQLYAGSSSIFAVSVAATGILVVVGLTSMFCSLVSWPAKLSALALAAGCLLFPFSLNLMAGGASTIPYRAMLGVPYVVWLFASMSFYAHRDHLKHVAFVLLIAGGFQLLHASSTYSASKQLTLDHDKALAGALYARITTSIDDFDRRTPHKIDFFGAKSYSNVFPRVTSSTIGGSFFDWDGGNPYRILNFMKLMGYDGLVLLSSNERAQMVGRYSTMPIWPAAGSVKLVDDVFLVKLGEDPGVYHK